MALFLTAFSGTVRRFLRRNQERGKPFESCTKLVRSLATCAVMTTISMQIQSRPITSTARSVPPQETESVRGHSDTGQTQVISPSAQLSISNSSLMILFALVTSISDTAPLVH